MPDTENGRRGAGSVVGELRELLVNYAKQETVEPLRSLKSYIVYGLAGSFLVGIGSILLLLSLLRGLQGLDAFDGDSNWNIIPYVITVVALGLGLAMIGIIIKRTSAANAAHTTDIEERT